MNDQKQWQIILVKFEKEMKWDNAITFMKNVIETDPDDMWAYISFIYMLMDLIVEDHPEIDFKNSQVWEYYVSIVKEYFKRSYSKFYQNNEYLYYTAIAIFLSPWLVDASDELVLSMFETAEAAEPNNPVYNFQKYEKISKSNPENKEVYTIAQINISENSPTIKILSDKGSIGEYLLEIRLRIYCEIAQRYEKIYNQQKRNHWQKKIDFLIENNNFLDALLNIENCIKNDPEDTWAYIYVVFILGKLLKNSIFIAEIQKEYVTKMNSYLLISYEKCGNQFDYILFMSIIAFSNKDMLNSNKNDFDKIFYHCFFMLHYAYAKYCSFYYLLNNTQNINEWRLKYLKDIIEENLFKNDFYEAGSLRLYIIECIQNASKIIIERYEKKHNDMSLN